jgi:hypothetical protein
VHMDRMTLEEGILCSAFGPIANVLLG